MNPEFKCPAKQKAKAAVAETKAAVAKATGEDGTADVDMGGMGDGAGEEEWTWGPEGTNTMHPFWAVRRLTSKQLAKDIAEPKYGTIAPRFNCEIEHIVFSGVTVGVVRNASMNTTRQCSVPFLKNVLALEEGEELILEVQDKTAQPAQDKKRTWKDALKRQELQELQAKKKTNAAT